MASSNFDSNAQLAGAFQEDSADTEWSVMSYLLIDQTPPPSSPIDDEALTMAHGDATVPNRIKRIAGDRVEAHPPSAGSEEETSVRLCPMDGRAEHPV
jgi:hypothetical protein